MRVDRSHFPWLIFILAATALSGLLYAANFHPSGLPIRIPLPAFFGDIPPIRRTVGGTPLGIIFGSIAYAVFLFAAALGIRKKKRLWPIGSTQLWLKAHLWLSSFTIPLVLFHCGFTSGGTHTTWLVVLYIFVMGSGFFGLALQQFIPRLMKERLPREVVFEQIPYLRGKLFESALKIRNEIGVLENALAAAGMSSEAEENIVLEDAPLPLIRFMDEECLPYLAANRGDRRRLGNANAANDLFRTLKSNVSERWQPIVLRLQDACNERRAMDLQTNLQHWLHTWLIVHVPTSFALLVFTAWHAWVAVSFLVVTR